MRLWRPFILLIPLLMGVFAVHYSCSDNRPKDSIPVQQSGSTLTGHWGLEKLSDYGLFQGRLADLIPAEGVLPYDLNMPLFSDYALKARFVKMPEGKKAIYNDKSVFEFPEGTILIKNFLYPNDFRDETKGRKIIETRLLIHESSGWKALPYIWNEEQTEAYLEVAGGRKEISWIHTDGKQKTLQYSIPNVNQCKGCHVKASRLIPIGPSARQLNKNFAYSDGIMNQLLRWRNAGILDQLPDDLSQCPTVPDWNHPEGSSLESRARAYLDINCAHCHSKEGPANTSGLLLDIHETNPSSLGIYKAPVAAGRGSGNLLYDIVPGKPQESILLYRMQSTDPGVMMPELGRKMVHEEGVQLISEWIAAMKPSSF
ncbi:MAG: hypothetical protein KatS3mg031_2604 [Chitinophagales bacterium]|nr:MAG: hypothetical protein KatS3mg031_2604 [Chitinophagales bacterium]